MKSLKNGTNILKAEITNVSQHGFWIYFSGKEYFLDYLNYPWFKDCTLSSLFNFTSDKYGNFHWKDLDIDLNLEIITNLEKYPLIADQ
ncbi:MAG: DUF2442 domain-containing protein [Bacteroidales bacterium]|nr:DUF2442 domain-containing protein [Bacteroidales bacterium]